MLGTAIDAGANHSVTNWLSTGPNGGNGAFDASVEGFSDDGTRSFFQTDDKMVAADTDDSIDIYERSGNTTTLISTGPNGGNGDFGADFFDASKDGSRVAFETNESLVAADNDGGVRDVYERANGLTLVRAIPHTGRTHQIRVHADWLGLPIANDKLYPDENVFLEFLKTGQPETRQALHATEWSCHSPALNLKFEAPEWGGQFWPQPTFSRPLP